MQRKVEDHRVRDRKNRALGSELPLEDVLLGSGDQRNRRSKIHVFQHERILLIFQSRSY